MYNFLVAYNTKNGNGNIFVKNREYPPTEEEIREIENTLKSRYSYEDVVITNFKLLSSESNHIERMEKELKELKEKIDKAEVFLENEKRNSKFLDETQLFLLEEQIKNMIKYKTTLFDRIDYDKNKK